MHVYSVNKPSLIIDPDVVVVAEIPSNVSESVDLARKMALERLGEFLDSYCGSEYRYYKDENKIVFRFYKD